MADITKITSGTLIAAEKVEGTDVYNLQGEKLGTVDDIIKITFWVKDPAKQRAALNDEWVKMFPDQDARPARHTQPLPADSRALVQADFIAVIA